MKALNNISRAREMAQLAKSLQWKEEGLSLDLQHPYK